MLFVLMALPYNRSRALTEQKPAPPSAVHTLHSLGLNMTPMIRGMALTDRTPHSDKVQACVCSEHVVKVCHKSRHLLVQCCTFLCLGDLGWNPPVVVLVKAHGISQGDAAQVQCKLKTDNSARMSCQMSAHLPVDCPQKSIACLHRKIFK